MTPGPADEPGPDLGPIEAALRSLAPTRIGLDRDRVLYRAGRASALGRLRPPWPAIAATLALVAGVEGAMLARPPSPRVVERIVVVREPAQAPIPVVVVHPSAPPTPAPTEVGLGLTERDRLAGRVIRFGLDGLASPRTGGSGGPRPEIWPATSRRLLQDEFLKTLRNGDPS